MKKVLIITYYWPPSGGAGVQRWVKFVKYLQRMEVEPYVLTVHPDNATYPQKDPTLENDIPEKTRVFYARSFELYALYKKLSSNKEVPYGGFANTQKLDLKEKIIRFIRGNFIIPDPRKGWNKYAFAKAKELIAKFRIDTVITTSPPHSTQLIGLKLKKELNISWVADLRDPWTDIYYFRQMYPTPAAVSIHKKLERNVLSAADRIITVSASLKKLFAEKVNGVAGKTIIIPNGYDTDDFTKAELNADPVLFSLSYVGTLSDEYNLNGLINALVQLPPPIKERVRVKFTGKMPAELISRFHKAGLDKMLELTGYVPHNEAIKMMFASDALMLIIPDVKNNEGILTGKLFEYLASRRPILFIGPQQGDAAAIIRETNSGTVCGYNDSDIICDTIISWFESKESGRDIHTTGNAQKYSRENLTKQLVKVLKAL